MIQGIDVSKYQGLIDWKAVANSGLVTFAFCKSSEGLNKPDTQFQNNWAGIKSVGLVRGAYHFGRPKNDPIVEADNFTNTIGSLLPDDMIVLDIEESPIAGKPFIDWTLAWLDRVEQTTGTTPILYTYGPFWALKSQGADVVVADKLTKHPLWLAAYVTNPDLYVPKIWKSQGWKLWQRAGSIAAPGDTPLYVPGIKGMVDKNVFKGTVDELKAFALNLHPGKHNKFTDAIDLITNNTDDPNS